MSRNGAPPVAAAALVTHEQHSHGSVQAPDVLVQGVTLVRQEPAVSAADSYMKSAGSKNTRDGGWRSLGTNYRYVCSYIHAYRAR